MPDRARREAQASAIYEHYPAGYGTTFFRPSYSASKSSDRSLSEKYIGDPDFGFGIDPEIFLFENLEKLPKLNSIDGRIVLQDLYETQYGIYNHLHQNVVRPLASVAMHSGEDFNDGSLLEEAIRTYATRSVKDLYGLNLLEFLDLPRDIIEMLLLVANEENSRKAATVANIEQQFNMEKK